MGATPYIGIPDCFQLPGFTFRARKVFQLANQEAHRLNHDFVGTEHLLLGLVKAGIGVAAIVLRNQDWYLDTTRREVEKYPVSARTCPITGRLPHNAEVQNVIQRAGEEAKELHQAQVGTGHLLLAMLAQPQSKGALILTGMIPKLRVQTIAALTGTNWPIVEEYSDHPAHGPCPELLSS